MLPDGFCVSAGLQNRLAVHGRARADRDRGHREGEQTIMTAMGGVNGQVPAGI